MYLFIFLIAFAEAIEYLVAAVNVSILVFAVLVMSSYLILAPCVRLLNCLLHQT